MKHAFYKIHKKNKANKSLILSDNQVAKKKLKKRDKLRKNDDEHDILGENSKSVQTWSNVPRFHMERMIGGISDKQKRLEKIAEKNKKANQKGISSFLEIDPYLAKCDYFEKQREELNKIKRKDVGINNSRALHKL